MLSPSSTRTWVGPFVLPLVSLLIVIARVPRKCWKGRLHRKKKKPPNKYIIYIFVLFCEKKPNK